MESLWRLPRAGKCSRHRVQQAMPVDLDLEGLSHMFLPSLISLCLIMGARSIVDDDKEHFGRVSGAWCQRRSDHAVALVAPGRAGTCTWAAPDLAKGRRGPPSTARCQSSLVRKAQVWLELVKVRWAIGHDATRGCEKELGKLAVFVGWLTWCRSN